MAHSDAETHRLYLMTVCRLSGIDPDRDLVPDIDELARREESLEQKREDMMTHISHATKRRRRG